ncbi:PREDICTED: 39S ribosomal protein L42, mitochondrial-like [Chrysochloris asiatica]|uniref:Large ribosomal subunit protein mL42 n=1 Tax=Chrysochloris asiatica TaxID=185453 RepID=A0A9B0U2I0_CHRAS|nr:PREDICTED: 39S ribosomal protein L42, mitochondrial-like [Chrysochloris asiatica]
MTTPKASAHDPAEIIKNRLSSELAVAAVKWALSNRTALKHLLPVQNGALYCVCHKSIYSSLPDDYNCKVELALTSDVRTIVCYHPSVDIPYEHTKAIPRPDPVHNNEETHDQVLKTRLEVKDEALEQGPMIEQLSKMFFTAKHCWYPHGLHHRRCKKLNPPKDRSFQGSH